MSVIRRQDYYKPMLAALAEHGIVEYQISPPRGRGHPILSFVANGGEHRIPLPGTPSSTSAADEYIAQAIRHRVKGQRK